MKGYLIPQKQRSMSLESGREWTQETNSSCCAVIEKPADKVGDGLLKDNYLCGF